MVRSYPPKLGERVGQRQAWGEGQAFPHKGLAAPPDRSVQGKKGGPVEIPSPYPGASDGTVRFRRPT